MFFVIIQLQKLHTHLKRCLTQPSASTKIFLKKNLSAAHRSLKALETLWRKNAAEFWLPEDTTIRKFFKFLKIHPNLAPKYWQKQFGPSLEVLPLKIFSIPKLFILDWKKMKFRNLESMSQSNLPSSNPLL